MSKEVEINGADAMAGSTFNVFKITGSDAPIKDANPIFNIMLTPIQIDISKLFEIKKT